ncbi:ABC transporter permease [Sphaerimonospora mesophila]|uniref:ABC transporter permease n=1 Tax=Sphaerimonospora mesophila TaxID=37483 RepID=UPI0007C7663F
MSDTTVLAEERIAAPRGRASSRIRSWLSGYPTLLTYLISISVALGISALLVMMTGTSPWTAVVALYEGSLSTPASVGLALDKAAPLLIVAAGTVIAARAGLFNIGQEGQLTVGATVACAVAIFVPGPGPLVLVLSLLGGALAGAAWAGIAAVLFYKTGVPIVIGTLLLVFIAVQVLFFAVTQPWLLQEAGPEGDVMPPQSELLRTEVWLPHIGEYPGLNFTSGVLIALALAVIVAVLLRHSVWGFKMTMLGMNKLAARRAGINAAVLGGTALLWSGAFAGLGGAVMLVGGNHRLQPGISENSGWDGLLVALVAKENPVFAIPVALFFGVLRAGGGFLASTGVPRYLVDVVTAVLVLAVAFPPAFRILRRTWQARAAARALAQSGKGAAA